MPNLDNIISDKTVDVLFELNYLKSIFDKGVIYSWIFYNKNKELYNLTTTKYKNKHENNIFYYRQVDEKFYIKCDEQWLIDNLKYIYISNKKKNESFELINTICNYINYTTGTIFNYTWYIPNFFKITIDLYSGKIILTKINEIKELKLTKEKLLTFLKNNKIKIKQHLEKEQEIKKQEKLRYELEKLQELKKKEELKKEELKKEKLKNNNLSDSTKKVGSRNKNTSFYIKRSLKERYETQTCKLFVNNFLWEQINTEFTSE